MGAKGAKGAGLTHVDAKGRIRMVDVGEKPVTDREAVARRPSADSIREEQEGRPDPSGAAGWDHGGEEDQ